MSGIFILLKQLSVGSLFLLSSISFGQEAALQEKIKTVQELMTTVEAHKITYLQDLRTITPGYFDYAVTEVNDKGQEQETVYTFGLSDINSKSVRSFTKKDIFLIELVVNGKQKLIKRTTDDGGKITYLADFNLYGLNADNGRDIKKAIEDAIPEAIALDEKALSLSTYEDHLKWLEDNVSNVSLPKDEITQQLISDPSKPAFVVLEQTWGSKKKRFEFNVSLLNPNSVNYQISGDEFSIEIATKKGVNAIKYLEDGELEDFTDRVTFYASSLSNGKNIHKVLKGIVPLSEDKFEASKPDIKLVPKALKYLNDHIGNVNSQERTTAQTLELKNTMASILVKETAGSKNEEHSYFFNIWDINKSSIAFKSKKTRLYLELNTSNGKPYIGHTTNGEPQNYEKSLMLYFGSMDEAIIGEEALKFLIENSEANIPDGEGQSVISLEEAVNQLKPLVKTVTYGDDQIGQHIELLETETSTLKLTKVESNPKKSTEFVFEFSIQDLNKRAIKVEVSGKRVWAELGTKSSKKVVKVYADGQVQNYRNTVEIEAMNVENAKEIVRVFERLAESEIK